VNVQPKNTHLNAWKWKPGQSGNPAGRPAGTPNKIWANLDFWMHLVETDWDKLEPNERVRTAMDAWKALLARKQMPMTPEESVSNADSVMKLLKVLEDAARVADSRSGKGSDSIGMEDRTTQVQAEGPAA